MVGIKWPDGKIICPKCGGDQIGKIETRSLLRCKVKGCRKQFSAKVGTIFEGSPIPLSSWFVAVWMIANCKNGISSLELHRAIGVTQKSAWFMLHRIRLAMRTGNFRKLKDVVESDETFVGGAAANMHAEKRERVFGGKAFDELARKLAQVPKPLVVAAEQRYEKKKQQRKKRRKS